MLSAADLAFLNVAARGALESLEKIRKKYLKKLNLNISDINATK